MNEKEQNQELEELEKIDKIEVEEDTTSGGNTYYEPEYVTKTKPLLPVRLETLASVFRFSKGVALNPV